MTEIESNRGGSDFWFEGKRVVVRRLTLDDIGTAYVAWFADPIVRKFIKWGRALPSLGELRDYWHAKSLNPGIHFLGIFDSANGAHIGNIKFEIGPAADEMHVGFLIGEREYRSQGILRDCLRPCIFEIRRRHQIKRLYLTVDPNNVVALKAFARLGFNLTGGIDAAGDLEMNFSDD